MASVLTAVVYDTGSDPVDVNPAAGSDRLVVVITCIVGAGDTMDDLEWGTNSISAAYSASSLEANNRRIYVHIFTEAEIAARTGNSMNGVYTGSPAGTNIRHYTWVLEDASQANDFVAQAEEDGSDPQESTFAAIANSAVLAVAFNNEAATSWTWGGDMTEREDNQQVGGTSTAADAESDAQVIASANPAASASANLLLGVRIRPANTGTAARRRRRT